jgi:hypothetical protein
MASAHVWIARARKAVHMSPRYALGRLRDELHQEARRPWSRVYPRLLADRTIIGESGAVSVDDLWRRQLEAPFFVRPADREAFVAAHARRFPDASHHVVTAADAAVGHQFDLLGSGPTRLGDPLPWLEDFKTGRRYALQYCRDIEYMELDRPTDVKVPWELSRSQHFTALGQAYWLTGDERYATEYVAQVTDWVRSNPWAYSVNWACAMDVALRAINWIWGFYFMGGSRACQDPIFHGTLLRSLFLHGEFVFTHLETSDVNGNHYLSDGAGLVFLGLFFRHTAKGRRWLATGRRIVADEMFAQVSEDGVDFEQSTAYHRLVLELFFTSYLLLERYGEPVAKANWRRLERMVEFVAAYTKPNGLAPLIGDADDGRVQKLGDQPLNDHRYLVSTAAVRFERADFKAAASGFAEESFWLLGPDGADRFDRLPIVAPSPVSAAFPAGGFYVLRSPSAHIVIDCGEVGMRGRGGHGHNDILSFELFMNGMNVVSDCGAYLYTASREWRNRFRSTAFHNVVQVDGEELNRFIGEDTLWQLRDDARPVGVRWETGVDDDRFGGGHTGYARLTPPVSCTREILAARDRPLVVLRDRVTGEGTRQLIWRFHFDPAVSVELVDGDCRIRNGDREVWLLLTRHQARVARLEPAWVSPAYGVRHASQVLIVEEDAATLPAVLSCLFAESRLPDDQRQRAVERLDARGARRP